MGCVYFTFKALGAGPCCAIDVVFFLRAPFPFLGCFSRFILCPTVQTDHPPFTVLLIHDLNYLLLSSLLPSRWDVRAVTETCLVAKHGKSKNACHFSFKCRHFLKSAFTIFQMKFWSLGDARNNGCMTLKNCYIVKWNAAISAKKAIFATLAFARGVNKFIRHRCWCSWCTSTVCTPVQLSKVCETG